MKNTTVVMRDGTEKTFEISYTAIRLIRIENEIGIPIQNLGQDSLSVRNMSIILKHGIGLDDEEFSRIFDDVPASVFMTNLVDAVNEFGDELNRMELADKKKSGGGSKK